MNNFDQLAASWLLMLGLLGFALWRWQQRSQWRLPRKVQRQFPRLRTVSRSTSPTSRSTSHSAKAK